MCEFFCIAFIEYTIAGKTLSGYINFFSPNDYQKNDKIIYKYFEEKYVKRFVFVSVFSGCVSISVLFCITSCCTCRHWDLCSRTKICASIGGIKKYL